jgi:hypothetical protein
MSAADGELLYRLLPAVYRLRDSAQGEPLRALLAVIVSELGRVEGDIARLYDNWFIETCDEWVVPYLGDLLGVRGLTGGLTSGLTQRGLVANALAYRRAKGTAAVLERLARDVSGWPAKAVEFFQLLALTQHVNHVRPAAGGTANLRGADRLELFDGPFEDVAHTAEVRHADNGRGRHNIPNLGLFLWRLQCYPVTHGSARAADAAPAGRYRFHPAGLDAPLFNRQRGEEGGRTDEARVPGRLRRRLLREEIEARIKALAIGDKPRALYFDSADPVLQVFVQETAADKLLPVPPEQMAICDLSDAQGTAAGDWRRPPAGRRVAVDPVTGRLVFPSGVVPVQVEVSFGYGFSGDLGGGPYDRRASLAAATKQRITWQAGVTKDAPAGDTQRFRTLIEAVSAWNKTSPGTIGAIALMDSSTYTENLSAATIPRIPAGSVLHLVAADWPEEDVPDAPGVKQRLIGHLAPQGRRPHLRGSLAIEGTAPAGSADAGTLILNGLLIEGTLTVREGNLGNLSLAHTTLLPSAGGLTVKAGTTDGKRNDVLNVTLDRCITGPVTVADAAHLVRLADTIVDGDLIAPAVQTDGSTLLGTAAVRTVEASDSIFLGTLAAARRQTGCVRFCYLAPGSLAPRRYRCQPSDPSAAASAAPQFTSLTFGQPGYAQLAAACPEEIASGAEDGGEMGAFHFLMQVQRRKSLHAALDEYLRFGLEAGMFFVT